MRIWSIHPKYLDTKGLVALWREALLAKHVLEGKTRGYKNHPQLRRFKTAKNPVGSMNQYLLAVYNEAMKRRYNFDRKKIKRDFHPMKLNVTKGQLKFEKSHLLKKLKIRDRKRYVELAKVKRVKIHPLFKMIDGDIKEWEKVDKSRKS